MIHLITPCQRPGNLPHVLGSIRRELDGLDWCWWTIIDGRLVDQQVPMLDPNHRVIASYPPPSIFAAGFLRNVALRQIQEGWVYDLDDDTIIHPNFRILLERSHDKQAVFFDQIDRHGKRICGPGGPYGTGIGAIRREAVIKEWIPDTYDTDQDYCAAHLQIENQIRFAEPGSYYNYLK